jgi:hypothetical protein
MKSLFRCDWKKANLMLIGMYVAAVADIAMAIGVWVLIYILH